MKSQYNKTITACFVGYIVQAIVNNFTPLLFFVFSEMLSYSNFQNYIVSDFLILGYNYWLIFFLSDLLIK